MQTRTEHIQAETTDTAPEPAPASQLIFRGLRGIRRAMAAARTILKDATGPRTDCRLISRAGQDGATLLATCGHRMMFFRIPADKSGPGHEFDAPLPLEAVRGVTSRKGGATLRIETAPSRGVTLTYDGAGTPDQAFPESAALQACSFERVLRDLPAATATARIRRTEALRALRGLPAQSRFVPACRLSIGPGGLKVWATNAALVGPGCPPDAVLAPAAEGDLAEETVFGLDRGHLAGALRTMAGATLSVFVADPSRPVRIASADETEQYVIAAARLT